MNLGLKIKTLRTQHNMTQKELAYALKVTSQAISKWETERNAPDVYCLPKIARLFDISLDELFEYNARG